MSHRWSYLPNGTFTDGLDIWDYVRLSSSDYNPGTRLVLRRPRLSKFTVVATIVSDIAKGKFWSVSDGTTRESLMFDNRVLPFEPGDELEIMEQASPRHALN